MGTWSAFYVKTSKERDVIEKLKSLLGTSTETIGKFPSDFYSTFIGNKELPNLIAVSSIETGWITVVFNGSNKLEEWGLIFSKQFQTSVIRILAQSVSDYYYFAYYEHGIKKREIEYCYSEDFIPVNFGDKFTFESEEPGRRSEYGGEVSYYFDFDSLEDYCKNFGLNLQVDYDQFNWTVLRTGKKSELKPWWKLW